MEHPFRLSALEQSIVREGADAQQALTCAVQLAREVEALGYHRLWVSEHHDAPSIAGSSPEVLLAAIGAATTTIRLGSGGVMLPHYSAYKVAENFATLSNLYPGRIDLGVGRAPGADMKTAVALATDGRPKFERFPVLVQTLMAAINDPTFSPRVAPRPVLPLPIWILGTSPDSAMLAAQLGLPYAIALFINPDFDPGLVQLYREQYQPSPQHPEPEVMISMQVYANESAEHARLMHHAARITFIRFVTGRGVGSISPEDAAHIRLSPEEAAYVSRMGAGAIAGTPDEVATKVSATVERYQADEFMAVCNSYHFEDRVQSFALLSESLQSRAPMTRMAAV